MWKSVLPPIARHLIEGRIFKAGERVVGLVLALAAAALPVGPAWAASVPKAKVEGDLNAGLRNAIVQAVGDSDRPIANRFEARRRATEAGENAISVLRSEGYYGYQVEPEIGRASCRERVFVGV